MVVLVLSEGEREVHKGYVLQDGRVYLTYLQNAEPPKMTHDKQSTTLVTLPKHALTLTYLIFCEEFRFL